MNEYLTSMQSIWEALETDLSDLSVTDSETTLSALRGSKEEEKTKLEKEKAEFLQAKKDHQEDILQALTRDLKEYVKEKTITSQTRQMLAAKDRQFQEKSENVRKRISDNQKKINAKKTELIGLPPKISDEELAKHIKNKTCLENMLYKAENEIADAEAKIAAEKKILENAEKNIVKIEQNLKANNSCMKQEKKILENLQMDLKNISNTERQKDILLNIYTINSNIEKREEWLKGAMQALESNRQNKAAAEENIRELAASKDLSEKLKRDIRPKLDALTQKIDKEDRRKKLSEEMNSLLTEQQKLENEAIKLNEEYQKFSESKSNAEPLFIALETDQEEEEEKTKSFEERLNEIDQSILEINEKQGKLQVIKGYKDQLFDTVNKKLLTICSEKKDDNFYFDRKCLLVGGNQFKLNINEFFCGEKERQKSLTKYKDFFKNISEIWQIKCESFAKNKNRISENVKKFERIAEILKQISDNAESYIESLFGHIKMSGHFTDSSMLYTRTREKDISTAPGVVTSFITDSSREEYLKKILEIFGNATAEDIAICYNTEQLLRFTDDCFGERVSEAVKNSDADAEILRLFVKCPGSGLKGCYFKKSEGMETAHRQDIDLIIMRLEEFKDKGIALSVFPVFDTSRDKTRSKFPGKSFEGDKDDGGF